MNLQQLEYIVAVDNHRHFARAADACFVSQPTLSIMIHKLEDELGLVIFDRKRQPVIPTIRGKEIIDQARVVLRESARLEEIATEAKEKMEGELSIGIIPTLAAYLVPLFIQDFLDLYPQVHITVEEAQTKTILDELKKGILDVGILATPLNEPNMEESVLFYEEFYLYTADVKPKRFVIQEDIDPNKLLLLEEGHCLRSQILNLCKLQETSGRQLKYQAGSLETLKRLVDSKQGMTILPELATLSLGEEDKMRVTRFKQPAPVREISLVMHRSFVKEHLIEKLKESILSSLPEPMQRKRKMNVIELGI